MVILLLLIFAKSLLVHNFFRVQMVWKRKLVQILSLLTWKIRVQETLCSTKLLLAVTRLYRNLTPLWLCVSSKQRLLSKSLPVAASLSTRPNGCPSSTPVRPSRSVTCGKARLPSLTASLTTSAVRSAYAVNVWMMGLLIRRLSPRTTILSTRSLPNPSFAKRCVLLERIVRHSPALSKAMESRSACLLQHVRHSRVLCSSSQWALAVCVRIFLHCLATTTFSRSVVCF